jgi:polysaccharide export outer membrane protein
MQTRFILLLLFPCVVCGGQSVLTTPTGTSESIPRSSTAPGAGVAQEPVQEHTPAGSTPPDGLRTVRESTAPHANVEIPSPTRTAGPLQAESEFERFAEDATGHSLPVYGRQLFDEVPTTFSPVEQVPAPADYVLGPGDELLIRAWGKIDLDSRVTLDRNGQINLPKVGVLTLAGLRYDQVEGYLHTAIGALFKDFELNVTLGKLRSIQIFILGSARQPGSYTVSSLTTLVDALFASGGPSANGSMRHIELRRGIRTLVDFDIYDLIRRGDMSQDLPLLPGDVIYIFPVGPQVAISGDVNEPGIYELKGDTTVAAALKDAGGVTSLASAKRVLVERIEAHSSRQVVELALDAAGSNSLLQDGDLLRIFPLSPRFENAVTLRGNVAQPGRYVWKPGMRVSDLIPSRYALVTREYWNRQNHVVPGSADQQFAASHTEMMTDVAQNNAEINWDYAVIERLDGHDLSNRLIPFHLGAAIDTPASSENKELESGDVLTIFSRTDIDLPIDKHSAFIRVSGEVNAPGVYRVNAGENLRDVVQQAGGLTAHSYLYASVFTRVSARHAQEEQLRQSAEQMQKELIGRYANSVPPPGQTAGDQQAQLALQEAALAKLTAIAPTGRVVLDMKPDAGTLADVPDFPLEDGDTLFIPSRLNTVQVAGAVYNANAFRYEPEKRLISYLNDAGGATREADSKHMYVIRADGRVLSRQSRNSHMHGKYEDLKLLPGDAIFVPAKLRVPSRLNDLLQATQLSSQVALTAAALSVVK